MGLSSIEKPPENVKPSARTCPLRCSRWAARAEVRKPSAFGACTRRIISSSPHPSPLPVTTDRIARLRSFGLSEYAARAYLALLDLGTTEARDVAALSKVPASKVYNILEQLHEKGLALILPEFPRKYAPVPFDDFLDRLRQEHDAAAAKIQRDLEDLSELYAVSGEAARGERDSISLVRGRRNVVDRLADAARSTEQEMLLAIPARLLEDEPLRAALEAVAGKGAAVKVLLPSATAVPPGVESRIASPPLGGPRGVLLVVDSRQAVLADLGAPGDGRDEGLDTAMTTAQEGTVLLLSNLGEQAWRSAFIPEPSFARSRASSTPLAVGVGGPSQTPPRP